MFAAESVPLFLNHPPRSLLLDSSESETTLDLSTLSNGNSNHRLLQHLQARQENRQALINAAQLRRTKDEKVKSSSFFESATSTTSSALPISYSHQAVLTDTIISELYSSCFGLSRNWPALGVDTTQSSTLKANRKRRTSGQAASSLSAEISAVYSSVARRLTEPFMNLCSAVSNLPCFLNPMFNFSFDEKSKSNSTFNPLLQMHSLQKFVFFPILLFSYFFDRLTATPIRYYHRLEHPPTSDMDDDATFEDNDADLALPEQAASASWVPDNYAEMRDAFTPQQLGMYTHPITLPEADSLYTTPTLPEDSSPDETTPSAETLTPKKRIPKKSQLDYPDIPAPSTLRITPFLPTPTVASTSKERTEKISIQHEQENDELLDETSSKPLERRTVTELFGSFYHRIRNQIRRETEWERLDNEVLNTLDPSSLSGTKGKKRQKCRVAKSLVQFLLLLYQHKAELLLQPLIERADADGTSDLSTSGISSRLSYLDTLASHTSRHSSSTLRDYNKSSPPPVLSISFAEMTLNVSRWRQARLFSLLLVLQNKRYVKLYQESPYAPITIGAGQRILNHITPQQNSQYL